MLRTFALGGPGQGPLIPCLGKSKLLVIGCKNGSVSIRSFCGQTMVFEGPGTYDLPEVSMLSVSYNGTDKNTNCYVIT